MNGPRGVGADTCTTCDPFVHALSVHSFAISATKPWNNPSASITLIPQDDQFVFNEVSPPWKAHAGPQAETGDGSMSRKLQNGRALTPSTPSTPEVQPGSHVHTPDEVSQTPFSEQSMSEAHFGGVAADAAEAKSAANDTVSVAHIVVRGLGRGPA